MHHICSFALVHWSQAPIRHDIAQFQAKNKDGADDMRSPRRRWPKSEDDLASLTSNGTSAGGKSVLQSFEERLRKRQESTVATNVDFGSLNR